MMILNVVRSRCGRYGSS